MTIIPRNNVILAILLALATVKANATMIELGNGDNNFTMLASNGAAVGGTNDVVAMWDGTFNTSVATAVSNMTISSVTPFFGINWYAHDVQVFSPGSYTFEACPGPIDPVTHHAADGSLCSSGVSTPQTLTVADGQVGVHMLFDWNGNTNIDVINVWNVNAVWGFASGGANSLNRTGSLCQGAVSSPECQAFLSTEWQWTATDPDGNGVPGTGMVDGPFVGFNAAFNIRPEVVPVPAAAWLLGSGLLGLIGTARRKAA